MELNQKTKKDLFIAQQSEITEHFVYKSLAKATKDENNKNILKHISEDEMRHYNFFKSYSQTDVQPDRLKIIYYMLLSKFFGITFVVKIMESMEDKAQTFYEGIAEYIPDVKDIIEDESEHEKKLIAMIEEERIKYMGSVVLGLNDALVELTGALAGLTFTLQKPDLVAITGLIIGISASLSMAGSEYLSTKSEGNGKNPIMAAFYTGLAYIVTVFLLILPYLLLNNIYLSLVLTLIIAILIIFVFNFYISVVQEVSFKKRFSEMLAISLGVASLSFIIGIILRTVLNIEV
jgi:VIT1/CCC1 family predicted Fe2+/Mn2+ transporter